MVWRAGFKPRRHDPGLCVGYKLHHHGFRERGMTEILTSRGMMPVSALAYTEGGMENDNEKTTWQEWRAIDGEIVKRNVNVTLKRGLETLMEQGKIG
jgi:hypothetical protein